jgi:hypothetical protein
MLDKRIREGSKVIVKDKYGNFLCNDYVQAVIPHPTSGLPSFILGGINRRYDMTGNETYPTAGESYILYDTSIDSPQPAEPYQQQFFRVDSTNKEILDEMLKEGWVITHISAYSHGSASGCYVVVEKGEKQ